MVGGSSLKPILEASLLAAGRPLSLDQLLDLFAEDERPEREQLRETLGELQADYQGRGIALAEVAGGYRIQVRAAYAPWVSRLWEEKPARYSKALMETLALIAYRQPITRGEIEDIRGVSVSTNITRTLLERDWVRVVGHRDVPGRPALYATTRGFLEYFSLGSLDDLPTLAELRDLDSINRELELGEPGAPESGIGDAGADDGSLGEEASPETAEPEGRPPEGEAASATGVDPSTSGEGEAVPAVPAVPVESESPSDHRPPVSEGTEPSPHV